MSDLLRMTGMYSGMDTESVISQLVKAKSTKVTKLKNEQKKLEWKQTAWQDLNSKIYGLWGNTLTKLRLSSAYKKKTTSCSDPTKASVIASGSAVNGSQTLKVNQLAKSGYITGAELKKKIVEKEKGEGKDKQKVKVEENWAITDKLSEISNGIVGKTLTVTTGKGENAKTTSIEIKEDMTINGLIGKFKDAGLNASFDTENNRFFISSTSTGADNDFTIKESGSSNTALRALGLDESVYYNGAALGKKSTVVNGETVESNWRGADKLSDIDPSMVGETLTFTVGKGADAKTASFKIENNTSINGLLEQMKKAGLNASFDTENNRFVVRAAEGKEEFSITSDGSAAGILGLGAGSIKKDESTGRPTRIHGQDAEIVLNGATFKSSSNAFSINGLTITATGVTEEEISIVTADDYSGIYDTIKDFITEYNELINEIDKLYNADSARKYDMLTNEEKEAMTDDEVEQWEGTIKGALLRKDSTLGSVMNSMVNIMMGKYYTVPMLTDKEKESMTAAEIRKWEKDNEDNLLHLSDFGIKTLSYFEAEDNKHHAYHIDGDPDDEAVAAQTDKLKAAIAANPEGIANFFSNLCNTMYTSLKKQMDSTDYSSIYKVYNDKQLKKDYEDYTKKIKKAEKDLSAYEDKWYDKFSAMEVALSKLQSSQNVVSSMLGM